MARQMKPRNTAEALLNEVATTDTKPADTKPANKSQAGLKADETRATLVFTVDQLDTLKDWAYTTRKTIKEVAQEMAQLYIDEIVNKDELLQRPTK